MFLAYNRKLMYVARYVYAMISTVIKIIFYNPERGA